MGDNSTSLQSALPVRVASSPGQFFRSVAAGLDHSLAVASDGSAWAWGDDVWGQLGDGGSLPSRVPVAVQSGPATLWTELDGGGDHSLGRDALGNTWAWGNNAVGQLGTGAASPPIRTPVPVATAMTGPVRKVSAGDDHSQAIDGSGALWSWGFNGAGALGDNSILERDAPVQVHGELDIGYLQGVTDAAGGGAHSLARLSDGYVAGFGANGYGQVGSGVPPSPELVPMRLVRVLDPLAPDQGNVLMAIKTWNNLASSRDDVTLWYPAAPGPYGKWRVYRDVVKEILGDPLMAVVARRVVTTTYVDGQAVPPPPTKFFYQIRGLSDCYEDPGL